ncbi:unnamed protein product, partial [Prorocentrum cordatum]
DTGSAFRANASSLLSKFVADARAAEEPQVMHKVLKFLEANAMLIHHYVKDMRGKMGTFVQSMPTGLLQTSVDLLPELENITRLIDIPGVAKGHKRNEDLTDLDQFCVHLEPLLKNSSKAVEELKDMIMMVNDTQDSIPVIGRFMEQILPDIAPAAHPPRAAVCRRAFHPRGARPRFTMDVLRECADLALSAWSNDQDTALVVTAFVVGWLLIRADLVSGVAGAAGRLFETGAAGASSARSPIGGVTEAVGRLPEKGTGASDARKALCRDRGRGVLAAGVSQTAAVAA